MYVNSSFSRPLQGMSLQSPETRQEGQCTLQVNLQTSLVDGLVKRIGTTMVSRIPDGLTISENARIHFYNRGDGESYWIICNPDSLPFVLDVNGNRIPVEVDEGADAYTISSNPFKSITMHTIGDFTFLCNKEKIPSWDETQKSTELTNVALVPVLFADYGKKYTIVLNGTEYTLETPDGSIAAHIKDVETSTVAKRLAAMIPSQEAGETQDIPSGSTLVIWGGSSSGQPHLRTSVPPERLISVGWSHHFSQSETRVVSPVAYLGQEADGRHHYMLDHNKWGLDPAYLRFIQYRTPAGGEWLVDVQTNTIVISRVDRQPFRLATADGRDGKDMPGIYNAVESIEKLPRYAPIGYMVKITGKGKSEDSQYWLKAAKLTEEGGTVRWEEAVAPSLHFHLDRNTMPHTLIRDFKDDGTPFFQLSKGEWAERKVGDDRTNPAPSFIVDRQPINAMGIFQNRLFFLAGESFVASQSNEFFNFFKTTTQTEEDDRVIDKYADTEEINLLQNYAALDGDLVLFAQGAQFVIKGDKAITADNMNMRLVTQYSNNAHIKPATTGETTIFSYNIGRYVQLREFFTDSFTDTKKARPITEHVDKLIEGNVLQMIGSSNTNTMLVRTDYAMNRMYMYDYLWQGDEKVQSAWWIYEVRVDDKIMHIAFDRSIVRMIVYRHGYGFCLEEYDIGDPDDEGFDFSIRLDSKMPVKVNRSSVINNKWTATVPELYRSYEEIDLVIGAGAYPDEIGNTVLAVRQSDGSFLIEPADLAPDGVDEVSCLVGIPYTSIYTPTYPVMKDEKGIAYGLDQLTVNTMYINYTNTGSFNCTVRNKYGLVRHYEYSGRVMGRLGNIVGFAKLSDGQFPVPIRSRNTDSELTVWSESYLPMSIRNIEWKGMINLRGRRV